MKVLIAAKHPGGGIKTYLRYVHRTAPMQNLSVTLLTPKAGARDYFEASFAGTDFEYIETGAAAADFAKALTKTMRTIRPDLLHAHGFTAALLAAIPAKVLGVPHIATTHDVFMPAQFKGFKGRLKRFAIGRLLSLPTVINPVGEDAKENLLATYPHLAPSRVKPIRNGIDSASFLSSETRDLRGELNLPANALLVGFFGRFMAQKGYKTLTDAISEYNKQTSGKKVNLVCFGWGGFIREEQARLRGSDVEGYIHYLDGTNDMPAALRGVDAAVMPSRWEACPLLPMEAMVSGTPVVASDCIGMAEVTADTPAITFRTGSTDGLVQALKELTTNLNEHKERALAFREEAAERFDVASTAASLAELYKQVVGKV